MSESKVAVIPGASAGVGLAAAKTLAGEGWRVMAPHTLLPDESAPPPNFG